MGISPFLLRSAGMVRQRAASSTSFQYVAAQTPPPPVQHTEAFAAGRRDADGESREEFVKILRSLPADRPQLVYSLCRELRSRHLLSKTRNAAGNLP